MAASNVGVAKDVNLRRQAAHHHMQIVWLKSGSCITQDLILKCEQAGTELKGTNVSMGPAT